VSLAMFGLGRSIAITVSLTAVGWEAPLESAPRGGAHLPRRALQLVGGGLQAIGGQVAQGVDRLGGAAVLGQAVPPHVGERGARRGATERRGHGGRGAQRAAALCAGRRAVRGGSGLTGAVVEADLAFASPAADPFMGGGPGYAHLRGHVGDRPSGQNAFDQDPPAVNGQPGITVGHEDLRVWCGA
jgi:hypothetical protein